MREPRSEVRPVALSSMPFLANAHRLRLNVVVGMYTSLRVLGIWVAIGSQRSLLCRQGINSIADNRNSVVTLWAGFSQLRGKAGQRSFGRTRRY